MGTLQSATPSRFEVDYPIGNQTEDMEIIRTGIASGSKELRPSRVDTRVAGIGTTITEADEMTSDEQVSCRTDKEGK